MFVGSFKDLSSSNSNFRQVLATENYSQIVAMSIPVNDDIGEEVHRSTDQIFIIASGEAEAVVGGEARPLKVDDLLVVPAGTTHNVKNIGNADLKLITIYAPPAHAPDTVQATK